MRSFGLFLLYISGAYLLAALLCAPIGVSLTEAAGVPAHKFIGRGGLLLALAGFWWFARAQQLANKQDLGYALPGPAFRRTLLRGFVAGVLILAGLSLALILLGIRVPLNPDALPFIPKIILQGLLGGLAVGFIEETFFRGAMYSAIRRRGGSAAAAILLPSVLYAALHFLKPQAFPPDTAVTLASSLGSLGAGFVHLFRWEHLDSFVALTLVGSFLGIVRHRSGHIAWCIGLHAGWVLIIRLTHKTTQTDPASAYGFLVGGYDHVIGWLASGWIGLLALVVWFWPKSTNAEDRLKRRSERA